MKLQTKHIGNILREVSKERGMWKAAGKTSWEISRFESIADKIQSKDSIISSADRATIPNLYWKDCTKAYTLTLKSIPENECE